MWFHLRSAHSYSAAEKTIEFFPIKRHARDAIDAHPDETQATIGYLCDASKPEPKKVKDPAALLSASAGQASDAGAMAAYHGVNHVAVELFGTGFADPLTGLRPLGFSTP